jgi:hypothetical protein
MYKASGCDDLTIWKDLFYMVMFFTNVILLYSVACYQSDLFSCILLRLMFLVSQGYNKQLQLRDTESITVVCHRYAMTLSYLIVVCCLLFVVCCLLFVVC